MFNFAKGNPRYVLAIFTKVFKDARYQIVQDHIWELLADRRFSHHPSVFTIRADRLEVGCGVLNFDFARLGVVRIPGIYIHPAYRRKGYCRKTLQLLKAMACGERVGHLMTRVVEADTHLVKVLHDLGFHQTELIGGIGTYNLSFTDRPNPLVFNNIGDD